MQLNAGMRVGGVFDDAQQAFIATFANGDGLPDGASSSKYLLGRCRAVATVGVPLERRVHGIQIRAVAERVDPPTFGGDRVYVAGPRDEDAGILVERVAVQKDVGSMDADDLALTLLAAILANDIIKPDLRPVTVGGDGRLPLG